MSGLTGYVLSSGSDLSGGGGNGMMGVVILAFNV